MKFKTIVLTKRTIMTVCAAIASAGIASSVFVISRNKSVEVFGWQRDSYEDILKESLPENDTSAAENILSKIIGFNPKKPETIIAEYSTSLRGTTYDDYAGENSPDLPDTAAPITDLPLPSHEEICSASGLKMNNATDYNVDIDALCAEPLAISAQAAGGEPAVLVMHTHTTECYLGDEMSGETERTTDEAKNVIAVGNEICSVLEGYGIKTIHDTTYHDYPSYQGSYSRAMATIGKQLEEYPSVNVVLDIHRDAFVYPDGSRLRVSCSQNGVQTAQVMLVVGTDSMGLWHENWRENLKFAAKIQNSAEKMYPNLMRPVNLRTERFNGHMTKGSLILEVGSNGNTLEEAKEGGRDVARAIAATLING